MKTASETLLETETCLIDEQKRLYVWGDDAILAMKLYAKQVAESVRDECIDITDETESSTWIAKKINEIDIQKFIK